MSDVRSDGLEVDGLTVTFGGNVAVENVSLSAPTGRITGLIGPNGAGKTTTFNAVSGLLRPAAGTIRIHGEEVTRRSPAARARLGLGRTFQRMELVNGMTVRQNVAIGLECRLVGANPVRQVFTARRERVRIDDSVHDALEACSIGALADRATGALSTGQRRLVELARTIAGGYDLLLLDEPSSGLDEEETDRFGAVLTRIVAERGAGILLVEHDMGLVMDVCAHIFVLDFGHLLFEGSAAEAQASDVVRAAYLGDEAVGAR